MDTIEYQFKFNLSYMADKLAEHFNQTQRLPVHKRLIKPYLSFRNFEMTDLDY
jgi:hypothetical protein